MNRGLIKMVVIAYARASDAPILLTKPEELPSVTLDAVRKLNTRSFVIIGGERAVSNDIANELAGLGSVKDSRRGQAGDSGRGR